MNKSSQLAADDLASKLYSFSLSTPDENLSKKLESTHITETHNVFAKPPRQQQPSQQPNSQSRPSNVEPAAAAAASTTAEEGWGELPPAYTAISQDCMFGFSSILQTHDLYPTERKQVDPNSPFGRYVNRTVTFANAAAPPSSSSPLQ